MLALLPAKITGPGAVLMTWTPNMGTKVINNRFTNGGWWRP
jgi:hypothetical protein